MSANRIVEVTFDKPARPSRIEDDAMFKVWTNQIPRLWFLDERQATRLDSESLYGAQEYAVLYNRVTYLILPEPVQTIEIGMRGYVRGTTRVIPVPTQSLTRTVDFVREFFTQLPEPTQEIKVQRASGSPVNPVPAPPEGADHRNP